MSFLEPIILGIIQGITEWLPVSSEGIASLVMVSFFKKSLADAVFFSLWLHLGTLLAALVYFWYDVKKIVKFIPAYIKKPTSNHYALTHFLVIATIMTGIVGIPLLLLGIDSIDISGTLAIAVIGFFLLFTGVLQLLAHKRPQLQKQQTPAMAGIVGFIQGFAVLPGLSRSGLTTATLLFARYDARQALRLSFLMSIPVVLLAQIGLVALDKIVFSVSSLIAVAVAFVVGLATLKALMAVAERVNFGWFCILLGLVSMLQLLL